MATSTETKIIEIKVESSAGLTRIVEVGKEISRLNGGLEKLNQNYKEGRISLENYTKEKAVLTAAIKAHRQEVNTLSRELVNNVKQTKEKLGYIQKLEAEVSNLTLKYKQLSKSELESEKGANTVGMLKNKRDELAKLNQAYGNYTHDVGNYAKGTNQLSIMMGQVMKEAPNFAISARIGIMSLSNNLVPLAEAIKAVKVQNVELQAQGKATQSIMKTVSQSIFGLTGILSMVVVLFQLFGEDIIKWVGSLFSANEAVTKLNNSLKELNKNSAVSVAGDMDKARLFALDYNKAVKDGNKERLESLRKVGVAEFGLHKNQMDNIGKNVNAWRESFKEYLRIAKDTYYNAELSKLKSETELQSNIQSVQMNALKKRFMEEQKVSEAAADIFMKQGGSFLNYGKIANERNKLVTEWNETQAKQLILNKVAFRDIYNTKQKATKELDEASKKSIKANIDYEYWANVKMWESLKKSAGDVSKFISQPFFKLKEANKKTREEMLQDDIKYLDDLMAASIGNIDEQLRLTQLQLEDQKNLELQGLVETSEQYRAVEDKYLALSIQANKDANIKKAESVLDYANAAADILDGAFAFSNALAENELDTWAKANKGKANFEEEYAAKKAELDHKAAVRNKAMQVVNSLINTASAVVAQLSVPGAGPALAIAAGIAGALQTAAIIATPIPDKNSTGAGAGTSKTPSLPPDLTSKMAVPLSSSTASIQSNGGSNAITSGAASISSVPAFDYNALAGAMAKQPAPQLSIVELKTKQKQVEFIDNVSTVSF